MCGCVRQAALQEAETTARVAILRQGKVFRCAPHDWLIWGEGETCIEGSGFCTGDKCDLNLVLQ